MTQENQKQEWGIRYKCPSCGVEIKFPSCPNFDNDKCERLAHGIYTACRNENNGKGRMCWCCESKKRRGEI